jgi:hypothetical protein
MNEYTDITLLPKCHNPPLQASLKALTRLNLSSTEVGDEGLRSLANLTALAHLELVDTIVNEQGMGWLAPLTAHLTHLTLTGENGDTELMRVCSLTALTHLVMLQEGGDEVSGYSEEATRALASLTGLVHLELDNPSSDCIASEVMRFRRRQNSRCFL